MGKRERRARSVRAARSNSLCSLLRQWIGAQLEVHGYRLHALAAFDQPWRAVAARGPQATAFPAGIRVVDAAVEALGIEAERVGHADQDHLPILERDQTVL